MARRTPDRPGASVAALTTPDPELGVPVPAYGGRSLPNVTSAVVRAVGLDLSEGPGVLPALAPDLDPFEGRRAEGPIVVLLVDGLGWPVADRTTERSRAGFPTEWTERARPITSVFPTTTTVALTSLTTAQSPSRHGVVGHRMYLPRFGVVAEILRMSPAGVASVDALAGPAWEPSMVSGSPSLFRRGVSGIALTRDRFEGTAFTRMLYDGARFVGFGTAAEFALRLGELVRHARPGEVIFAYWDDLDAVQHVHGPSAEFDAFEANQVRLILAAARRRLSADLARRTTVLITGDHGQVAADAEHEIAVDRHPEIVRRLARPPAGDRRSGFLAARPGDLPDLERALAPILPAGHHVLPMRRALERGLFGPAPFHPEISDRLGDLLVLVPPPGTVTYRLPGIPPRPRYLPGAHGGLDPAELLIPLIAGPLAQL